MADIIDINKERRKRILLRKREVKREHDRSIPKLIFLSPDGRSNVDPGESFKTRTERIKASLDRINKLMSELKDASIRSETDKHDLE